MSCRGSTRWNAHPRALTTASLIDQSRADAFPNSPPATHGMFKLLVMEHPVKGVSLLEFIGPRHIDADIGPIRAEGGPDVPSTFAEGDGLGPGILPTAAGASQAGLGPRAWCKQLCRRDESISSEGSPLPPGDPTGVISGGAGLLTRWSDVLRRLRWLQQGCIEDRSPSMSETHSMDGYVLVIFRHLHSNLATCAASRGESSPYPICHAKRSEAKHPPGNQRPFVVFI